jgi:hypothetical protein
VLKFIKWACKAIERVSSSLSVAVECLWCSGMTDV